MQRNRSIPDAAVIPVLVYPDVRAAVAGSRRPSASANGSGSERTTAPRCTPATAR